MGRRVRSVNDIEILREMLSSCVQVSIQSELGRNSVQLTDSQSGATVKIKGVPPDSIVIRAEEFMVPLTIFNGTKGENKRADYVLVSTDESGKKWIVCIETQKMDSKLASHVIKQLKGACCFIRYCKCIGKSFWNSDNFLDNYEYRFVSIVEINPNRSKRRMQPFYSINELHNSPETFKKIPQRSEIYFKKLIHPEA